LENFEGVDMVSDVEELKLKLVEVCRRAYERQLVVGTSGNASARLGREILATPAECCLGDLTPADMVKINLSGEKLAGQKQPTSELAMHLALYRARPDIKAVLHTHPSNVTLFALRGEPIPAITPELALRVGKVAMIGYHPPGSGELAEEVATKLRGSAAVLERHGLVTVGQTPLDALYVAEAVERAAKVAFLTRVWSPGR